MKMEQEAMAYKLWDYYYYIIIIIIDYLTADTAYTSQKL